MSKFSRGFVTFGMVEDCLLYTSFALVAGDFDVLRDTFKTRSGREVALELFVDRGNLDRAP